MMESDANARLKAFCDGVFAIALTLLIVDIKLPASESVSSTSDLWRGLGRLAPSVFAFLLSFGVVLITWVNHHGVLKLVRGSSASFMYANGLLLLTVVVLPFPTSLLGAFLGTDRAEPAVVLYDAVLAVQAIGWLCVGRTALQGRLLDDERATEAMRAHVKQAYFAFALYALFALVAWWYPIPVAVITAATWLFWLILSIRMKQGG